ncbi:MAG: hypothetical protein NZ610_03835 [Candidatus Bipolaricaulota bacterium]|nr:hypothetical protein [Candidatus Bipolaricaulota bacterium]MCS7274522.1 hypothetical protein [Candidatus Bipolaricaulota bacterium]MDW8329089.1 hypothetical protein [Candidatus Bipolaricaulota bacterium]
MRRLSLALLALAVLVVGAEAPAQQVLSAHSVLRLLSAEGDLTSSDLQPALGTWRVEISPLPTVSPLFEAIYLVDANADGKFDQNSDPVYALRGVPRLATANVTVRCSGGSPLFIEGRIHVLLDVQVTVNGQPRGGVQFATLMLLALGDLRTWTMMLSLDLNGDGVSDGITGIATRVAPPLIAPSCPS